MGGNAFPDLYCPRLPNDTYLIIRDRTINLLKDKYFDVVVSPPSAPSKKDHGDIDFIVSQSAPTCNLRNVIQFLGAVKHIREGSTASLAVKLEDAMGTEDTGLSSPQQIYVQIDFHACQPVDLAWTLFEASYGDLMQILGVMNRPIGLTANDSGLHVRIEGIEQYNRKKSLIFLTDSPSVAMGFLGLDFKQYYDDEGFKTNEDVFSWCAKGRFYTQPSHTRASEGGSETANDRQRYRKREMFTTCMHEYYPAHPELFSDKVAWTRQQVLEEALNYFPASRPLYETAMEEHKKRVWEEGIMDMVKESVPLTGNNLRDFRKGLKRFVRYQDGKPTLCDDPYMEDIGDKPTWIDEIRVLEDAEVLIRWIRENDNYVTIRAREVRRAVAAKAERKKKDSARATEADEEPVNYRPAEEHEEPVSPIRAWVDKLDLASE